MKKPILIALMAIMAITVKAQKIKEYQALNGITYHLKDTVHLGMGSGPSGDFLYLQIGGWAAAMVYKSNGGPDQLNIGRGYANTVVIIKKIETYKINGATKVVFTVGGGNITNYLLIIDDAIQVCEVTPCQSNDQNSVIQQSDDKFDKIKKLKALLDSGAITQAEYDEQKKKLLGE